MHTLQFVMEKTPSINQAMIHFYDNVSIHVSYLFFIGKDKMICLWKLTIV